MRELFISKLSAHSSRKLKPVHMARSTRSSTRASSSNEPTVTSSNTNNQQDGTTIANQNVIVAKQVIKCPKVKEVSPQHIADKLVQYERYLREHDIDPEKVSAMCCGDTSLTLGHLMTCFATITFWLAKKTRGVMYHDPNRFF